MLDKKIIGDKSIWFIFLLFMIGSIISIYTSSSFISSRIGVSIGDVMYKHIIIIIISIFMVFLIHKIPSNYFSIIFKFLVMPIIIVMLIYLIFTSIGANSSEERWIRFPIIGSFQPSFPAILGILIITSSFVSNKNNKNITYWKLFKNLIFPILLILMLIFPSNLSTAIIGFLMFFTLLFISGVKTKYLLFLLSKVFLFLFLLFLIIKSAPENFLPTRLTTWEARIEDFINNGDNYDYQMEKARAAISIGGLLGQGPGKSTQKYNLPQSESEFIFSIIIEEYGIFASIILIFMYLFLFWRSIIIIEKSKTKLKKLLVLSAIMPIIFSGFINMGVATDILPITGQPLPFISAGGTSMIIYSICIGIILSISREIKEAEKIKISSLEQN